MTTPVSITFRDLAVNADLEALIHERANDLGETFGDLRSCRVTVEVPHRHHRSGNRYHVRVELGVPGDVLIVSHQPSLVAGRNQEAPATKATELDAEFRDGALAVREAFDIARRQLQAYRDRLHERSQPRA